MPLTSVAAVTTTPLPTITTTTTGATTAVTSIEAAAKKTLANNATLALCLALLQLPQAWPRLPPHNFLRIPTNLVITDTHIQGP